MAAAVVVPSAIVLEVLNENNYDQWSVRVKTYLMAKDLWDVVEATTDPSKAKEEEAEFKLWKKKKAKDLWDVVEATTEPPKAKDEEAEFKLWKKKNAEALHVIQISCGTALFSFIATLSTAKMAWDTLEKTFKYTLRPKNIEKRERPLHTATDAKEEELVLNEDNEIEATNEKRERPLHTSTDAKEEELVLNEDQEIEATNDDSDFERYEPFFDCIETGYWDAAKEFLTEHPNAVRVRSPPPDRETALHLAVRYGHVDIVKELVGLMTGEDLEIKDADGDTAFSDVFYTDGPIQMVQCMVEKNKKLLGIRLRNGQDNITPVLMAYIRDHFEMAQYLYSVTPLEDLNGPNGAELITRCFYTKDFDFAWKLIKRCPNVITTMNYNGQIPLCALAGMSSAFLSGSRLTLCEQWIYNFIYIQPTRIIDGEKESTPSVNYISVDVVQDHDQDDNQRNLICSVPWPNKKKICDAVRSLFRGLVANLLELLGIYNRIYEMKSTHVRVLELIHLMCEVTNLEEVQDITNTAIIQALKRGHVEFITHICTEKPNLLSDMCDSKGRSIFHCAVEYRQEKIYSLIHDPEVKKDEVITRLDNLNNTTLHKAANLSTATAVQGAALQMQRELQWLKEVESIVPARIREHTNLIDGLTARELFTKNHKGLVKEGEKSMKETATSCTVVGALIVTIMFAAAFTIPGGNKQDTGVPIFLDQMVFMVFIVSDAISLFSSTTSVMIFLGILTSRYAEDDFFKSLPTKMILGLFSLFLSIATMMIAFSSALLILLHDKLGAVIPIILLASVPVASFIWLQFPFLVEIFISTYGSGIFDKKVKRR